MPHLDALLRAARRLTQDDVEDVVQETYLRAYRTFGNFQAGTNARAWLFTILRSVVLNRRRGKARRPPTESLDRTPERDPTLEVAPMMSTQRSAADEAARERVREALSMLDPDMRWVLMLVDVEEFSYAEVAQVLSCPMGTVSSRVYRARKALEQAIGTLIDRAASLGGQPQ